MRILLVSFFCVLLMLPECGVAQDFSFAQSPKREYRAVWLTTIKGLDWPKQTANTPQEVERQQESLCAILDSLQAININTVLLQTRIRGDVIYPSQIEPFNSIFTGKAGKNPGYDPLAFAIDECHKRGIQLHAWIVTLPLGDKSHVVQQGKQSITRKQPKLCCLHRSSWYMEPGNPDTHTYLTQLVREIVSTYDVDGIHFDYIRYPDNPAGYSDSRWYRLYGKGMSLNEWRRSNITALARTLYHEIKSLKPWVSVSCAPLGKYRDTQRYSSYGWNAYYTVFQETQEWLKEGITDVVFPMLYFKDNHFYPFLFQWKENAYGRHIVPGIGAYQLRPDEKNWALEDIQRELYVIRDFGLDGEVYFRAFHLCQNTKGILNLLSSYNALPALTPPLTWCDSVAPEAPKNLYATSVSSGLELKWDEVSPASNEPNVLYNVYADNDFPVDITSAKHLIATRLVDNHFSHCFANKSLNYAVTAIDRFGNESEPIQLCTPKKEHQREKLEIFNIRDKQATISIYDLFGRRLTKMRFAPQINLSKLPPGNYILKVHSKSGECLGTYPFTR